MPVEAHENAETSDGDLPRGHALTVGHARSTTIERSAVVRCLDMSEGQCAALGAFHGA